MSKIHPLDEFSIILVEKIVESIFAKDRDTEELINELTTHLEKSRKFGALRYEVETLNAISLCYSEHKYNWKKAEDYLEQALVKAIESEDIALQAKILNNLGSCSLAIYDMKKAEEYIEEGLAIQKDDPIFNGVRIFLLLNLSEINQLKGDWNQAKYFAYQVLKNTSQFEVPGARKNDFIRGIYYLRAVAFRVYIIENEYEKAFDELNLMELSKDIDDLPYLVNKSIYDLLTGNTNSLFRFRKMIEGILDLNDIYTFVIMAIFLHHVQHSELAKEMANIAIDRTNFSKHSTLEQNMKKLLQPIFSA